MKVERPDRITIHTTETKIVEVEPIHNTEVFAIQLRKFIDALETTSEFRPSVQDGAIATFLVEAANKSVQEGRKINLSEL